MQVPLPTYWVYLCTYLHLPIRYTSALDLKKPLPEFFVQALLEVSLHHELRPRLDLADLKNQH